MEASRRRIWPRAFAGASPQGSSTETALRREESPKSGNSGAAGNTGTKSPSPNQSNPGNLSADEAILSSVEVLCRIGGLLILFSIAVEFLRCAGQLPAGLRLFLMGTMEMTTGIRTLAAALPFPYSAAAACASLTFGGLSGILQTKAALGALAQKKKAGLSIRQYCAWKLLYACLTAAILLTLEA